MFTSGCRPWLKNVACSSLMWLHNVTLVPRTSPLPLERGPGKSVRLCSVHSLRKLCVTMKSITTKTRHDNFILPSASGLATKKNTCSQSYKDATFIILEFSLSYLHSKTSLTTALTSQWDLLVIQLNKNSIIVEYLNPTIAFCTTLFSSPLS